jgi:hypothetical protein
VTISLEAVIFEDGTSFGRDASKSIPRLKALLKSEYVVYRAVVDKAASGSAADVTSYLRTVAATHPPGSNLRLGADPFPALYQYYGARTAAVLLNGVTQMGMAQTVSSVRSLLQSKPYPALLIN